MKLRNKKTGEVRELPDGFFCGDNLKRIIEDWEDYEELKKYWYIEPDGSIIQNHKPTYINHLLDGLKSIGNYFETKEEAEQAVEKLKAAKRLKDKGLTFCAWKITDDGCSVDVETTLDAEIVRAEQKYITDDLNLLFGGEE